jgi:uncharacterized membrane protein YgdD (TMEM256/DUF423 family)
MQKTFGIIAAAYGALAVILGAFGAHALKEKLDAYQLEIFNKGVQYQFYHVVALFAVVFLAGKIQPKTLTFAGWFFTVRYLVFFRLTLSVSHTQFTRHRCTHTHFRTYHTFRWFVFYHRLDFIVGFVY